MQSSVMVRSVWLTNCQNTTSKHCRQPASSGNSRKGCPEIQSGQLQ
ncbi:hypothetical protein ACDB75_004432 [Salmonella enterica]